MNFPAFARFPWNPWTLALAVLVGMLLIVLAVRTRRRLWKIVSLVSAVVVLLGSCGGLGVASLYHVPATNVMNKPAPVPNSFSLSFMHYAEGSNWLTTLNARTGALRWQHPIGDSWQRATADEQTLYLLEEDAQSIIAMRASDGKELWRTPIHHPIQPQRPLAFYAAPVVSGGMVYFNAILRASSVSEIVVFALSAATGALAWTSVVRTGNAIAQTRTIAVGRGMLVVSSTFGGEVFALRAGDGVQIWSQRSHSDEYLTGTSAFAGTVVYVPYAERMRPSYKRIVALNASDGTQLWSQPLVGRESDIGLSIGASSLYLDNAELGTGSPDVDYLYSLSAQTGQLQWKYRGAHGIGQGITAAGNLVYFANGIYVDALRVNDGQRVWRYSATPYYVEDGESYNSTEFGAPVSAQGALFLASQMMGCDGCKPREGIDAINPLTGALYWHSAWGSVGLTSLPLVTTNLAK